MLFAGMTARSVNARPIGFSSSILAENDMYAQSTDRWTLRSILVVMACGIGNIVGATSIINATFSNFLIPVSDDLSWSRAQFSFVLTLVSFVGVLAYPFSGALMDRYGVRPVLLIGNLLFGTSVALVALVPPVPLAMYLLFALIGLTATMPSTVLFARVVSTWFIQRRGLVLGLSGGLAFGIGGSIMPSVTQIMIDHWGWRGAYAGLGGIVVGVGFPIFYFLVRELPEIVADTAVSDSGPSLTRREAFRLKSFWLLFGAVSLGAGAVSAAVTHLVPLALGAGAVIGAALAAIAGHYAVNAVWQIALGAVLDRVRSPRITAVFILPGVLALVLLYSAQTPGALIAGGMLLGVASGTEYGLLPFCIPRYFGFRSYGEIYGTIFGAIMLMQGVMPFAMDVVFDMTGSYRPALAAAAVMLAGAAGLIALLPRFEADGATDKALTSYTMIEVA
jgi:predicted MFS family arabinose efflux permease